MHSSSSSSWFAYIVGQLVICKCTERQTLTRNLGSIGIIVFIIQIIVIIVGCTKSRKLRCQVWFLNLWSFWCCCFFEILKDGTSEKFSVNPATDRTESRGQSFHWKRRYQWVRSREKICLSGWGGEEINWYLLGGLLRLRPRYMACPLATKWPKSRQKGR